MKCYSPVLEIHIHCSKPISAAHISLCNSLSSETTHRNTGIVGLLSYLRSSFLIVKSWMGNLRLLLSWVVGFRNWLGFDILPFDSQTGTIRLPDFGMEQKRVEEADQDYICVYYLPPNTCMIRCC